MFTVDIIKGPRNEAAAETKSTVLLNDLSVKVNTPHSRN